ncbi:hypothetical protein KUTeg_001361 [Tegillarca granosa]|uniref:Myb-like domain-containing protein n=1 Tax=Tegillarca granosa TaxID=220873 RepID=A0ABQ9FR68_TEGGR|nr:hypothetical protein KUTeg_001361 [Tegillarca granosa]
MLRERKKAKGTKLKVAFPYAAKDECFVDFCFEVIMQNRRRRQNPFEVAKYWCDKGQDPPGFEIDSYENKDFPELEDLDSELEDDSGKQEVSVNVEDNQNTAAKTKDLEKETKKAKGIKRKRWTQEEEKDLISAFKQQISERKNVKTDEIEAARKKFKSLNDRSEAVIRSKVNNIILGKLKKSITLT